MPTRSFYERESVAVTQELIGCLLLRIFKSETAGAGLTICGGRIVEAEAYLGEHDPAAHAARGRTASTDVMYREGGHAYVYKIYGMHYCLNAVAERPGTPGCVLIRALEPLFGIEEMLIRRRLDPEKIKQACSGPGKLCQALAIDTRLNGADLIAQQSGMGGDYLHKMTRFHLVQRPDIDKQSGHSGLRAG
jgi:DNA-3-methyladenine glycosylase